MKKILIILSCIVITSCTEYFDQNYYTFDEYNLRTNRNKSWFPDLISKDAYEIRSKSYLNELCAFGCFRYRNNEYYDSAFRKGKIINFTIFTDKVNFNKKHKPDWFEIPVKKYINNIETMQKERFYIARDKLQKKIYFVLSY